MNNKNDSVKIILIIAIVVIAGYFLFKTMSNRQAGQAGLVVVGTPVHTEGSPCTLPDGTQGVYDANGSCVHASPPYFWVTFEFSFLEDWYISSSGHGKWYTMAYTGNNGGTTGGTQLLWGQGNCPTILPSQTSKCVSMKLPGGMTPATLDLGMRTKVGQQLSSVGFGGDLAIARQASSQDINVLAALSTLKGLGTSTTGLKAFSVTASSTMPVAK